MTRSFRRRPDPGLNTRLAPDASVPPLWRTTLRLDAAAFLRQDGYGKIDPSRLRD